MNLVAPYNLIAKYKKLAEAEGKNKKGDEVKKPSSPIWLGLWSESRTLI
jgi:hypothetical protein